MKLSPKITRILLIALIIFFAWATQACDDGEIITTGENTRDSINQAQETIMGELNRVNDMIDGDAPVCYDLINSAGDDVGDYCE